MKKLMIAKTKNTIKSNLPISIESPATPLAPRTKATMARIKKAIAALNIATSLYVSIYTKKQKERPLNSRIMKNENCVGKIAPRKGGKMPHETKIIGQSPSFQSALQTARSVSSCTSSVLILGESGSGKEMIARTVHESGTRRSGPFVPLNCSAIPETLLESELFGYARGAFTGAQHARPGLFEEAHGGTLFLDEISDLSLPLQAKLLRVLQDKSVKRVGENHYRDVDIRIVAATHENLRKAVEQKIFREDLFFRLNVIPINIPPLRERLEDILPLANYFIERTCKVNDRPLMHLSEEAQAYLTTYPWPGNVRELENAIERVVVLNHRQEIGSEHFSFLEEIMPSTDFSVNIESETEIRPIEEVMQKYIQHALAVNKGQKNKTAKDLGIDRKTLYRKLHL
jgi:transcriptional regulator with PAS, ATPase and Fis domain